MPVYIDVNVQKKPIFNNSGKILIYTDGHTTFANKIVNGITTHSAEAKCDFRYDKFDFNTGAKIAFNRLIEKMKEIPWEDKFFNGKALCFNRSSRMPSYCKEYHVYEFKDGLPVDLFPSNRELEYINPVTNGQMKNNTGWTKNWFIPIFDD